MLFSISIIIQFVRLVCFGNDVRFTICVLQMSWKLRQREFLAKVMANDKLYDGSMSTYEQPTHDIWALPI